ncbi:carboxylesterase family protein [Altererythrobacter salegens]|uniref:Carboxylic ester hydrolase n=1 Tax=Croceibacterium salegens TaxID=1737568 RepID=A0A6I4SYN7_9SPHN|nr:carboxylesterase family protein [Croceibacterium salegens]MXO60157.1 carboxylesterase family protein [Croceibacterium salegens]
MLVTVDVPGGQIVGHAAAETYVSVFRGIPYAAPPTGELRWRPPQAVVAWQGVRDATAVAPACLQHLESSEWNRAQWLHASEDCLTLDVKTSSLTGKRPVMVWIHGGSNRAGASGGPADSDLTAQGVVAVSVQYRLGALGWLSHPALSAEQGGSSGNYGLMDQIAALQWVHDNIAKFGGDPDNVTIYGESAGSQDVSLLLAAPAAQGLFHKAIMESGTPGFGLPFRSLADAEAMGKQFSDKAGTGNSLEQMRALSPVAIFAIEDELQDPPNGNAMIFLHTTVDGKVLPAAPDKLIAANKPKPVILGTNKVEFSNEQFDEANLPPYAKAMFGEHGAAALELYRIEKADPRRGKIATRIISDALFHCPTDHLADLLAENDYPTWRYQFDVGPNGGLTSHAFEIGWVFERKPVGGGVNMQDYWAALAVAGDPNGKTAISTARPKWERWTVAKPQQIEFGETATAMAPGKPRKDFCDLTEAY